MERERGGVSLYLTGMQIDGERERGGVRAQVYT